MLNFKALLRKLVVGWCFTLVSFGILALFPRVELSLYDRLVGYYRDIPEWLHKKYPALNRGYVGLHRSISLIGDATGESNRQIDVLRHLRQDFAAAACWVTTQPQPLPRDLANQGLEQNLVYSVSSVPRWDGKSKEPPPLVLKQSEADSTVREVYLALKSPQGLVSCLPLVLYARFLNEPNISPEVQGSVLTLGDRAIPVNEDAQGYSFPIIPYNPQVRAHVELGVDNDATVADPMEPLNLNEMADMQFFFGQRVRDRFYFMGDYSMTAIGEHVTSLGPFRDFQIAALSLDTLIQGPYLRWVSGSACIVINFLLSSALALWLLSPTTGLGRLVRAVLTIAGCQVVAAFAFVAGYYMPLTWAFLYVILLNVWILAKIWWSTLSYLRRYGGATAAHMLATGQVHLDHGVAEERIVTIVFVGLPAHLRQQELEDDPLTLKHRQIFSKRVADITYRQHGIVHDFQADYLMLGFGTHPGEQDPNHAIKAFRAANELIAAQEFFEESWKPRVAGGSRVQVSLNVGLVAIGWVGTTQLKRASAAIGDTTNVAARLLGTAKKYDVDMILSESTFELLKDQAQFEALPPVMLKGKTEAVAIYKLAEPE